MNFKGKENTYMKIGFSGNRSELDQSKLKYLTLSEIADAANGRMIGGNDAERIRVYGMCTDSREAEAGVMFAAIKGERTDGHNYISTAIQNGCDCFLCERIPTEEDIANSEIGFVAVKDTVKALADIAKYYSQGLSAKTIGITGSVGKTTTKEFIDCVLSQHFVTHKTEGNYNSAIGLPLVVLETPYNTEVQILEMGMGNKGDIAYLSDIAVPDVGIITNIGHAHIEALGSRENICKAKLEIAESMKKGSILFLNGDEPLLDAYENPDLVIYRISLKNNRSDIFAQNIKLGFEYCSFDIIDNVMHKVYANIIINTSGEHNIYAALFAYAVGAIAFKMDERDIRSGLGAYQSVGLRQKVTYIKENILIEDCYNAGPESMSASLENLRNMGIVSGRGTVAVLGDMLELGDESKRLHREIGKVAAKAGARYLVLFGTQAQYIKEGAIEGGYPYERIYWFESDESSAVASKIASIVNKDDIILFKASRGMRAELISDAVKDILS